MKIKAFVLGLDKLGKAEVARRKEKSLIFVIFSLNWQWYIQSEMYAEVVRFNIWLFA